MLDDSILVPRMDYVASLTAATVLSQDNQLAPYQGLQQRHGIKRNILRPSNGFQTEPSEPQAKRCQLPCGPNLRGGGLSGSFQGPCQLGSESSTTRPMSTPGRPVRSSGACSDMTRAPPSRKLLLSGRELFTGSTRRPRHPTWKRAHPARASWNGRQREAAL